MPGRITVENDIGIFTFEFSENDRLVTEVMHRERMDKCDLCKSDRETHRTCAEKTKEYRGIDIDMAILAEKFTCTFFRII